MIHPVPKPKTYRSKKYLAFIRTKPCIKCGNTETVAHHEPLHSGGKGIKGPDCFTVPLCVKCHDQRHREGSYYFWDDESWVMLKMLQYIHEYLTINNLK